MHSKVYIVSSTNTDAARYAYDFVFKIFFETEVELVSSANGLPDKAILIAHGVKGIESSIIVPLNNHLQNTNPLHPSEIELGNWDDLPTLFPSSGDLPFDIFSSIFYLLARVEEYAITERDQHERFEWKNSILSDSNFCGKPIVDLWLLKFGEILKAKFPQFQPKARKFEWINTYDIDIAFAYTHRSPMRVIAATGKNVLSGDLSSVTERGKVFLKATQDPFDTYAFQEEISKHSNCQTIYFFLLGSGGKMDRNISPKNQKFQKLIKHISTYSDVGIHPSYLSGDKPSELTEEIKNLERIIDKPVTLSRQHFLRMKLPETYRRLIREGIQSDYTMGYAEQLGFRSGTCTPHLFFDLTANEVTGLKVYPLTVMEGTLRDYLKLNPEKAKLEYKKLIDIVYEVGGTFISLWHNDSLKEGSEWRDVYQFMANELEEAISKEGN